MTTISVITGSSRGIGRSIATNIARRGGDVVLVDRSELEAAEEVVKEITALGRKAVALRLDVGNISSFAAFKDELEAALRETWKRDTFDHLINNAGHGEFEPFEETTEQQFDGLLNVHFKGVFFLTQALLPLIADGGGIVNITSVLTRMSVPGYAAYAVMKGAVEVMTRYLAKELGERKIRVNAVAPGAIETDFGGGVIRDDPETNQYFASITPLGRVGLPDDIGLMVAGLFEETSRWITGQRIEVSGGQAL